MHARPHNNIQPGPMTCTYTARKQQEAGTQIQQFRHAADFADITAPLEAQVKIQTAACIPHAPAFQLQYYFHHTEDLLSASRHQEEC